MKRILAEETGFPLYLEAVIVIFAVIVVCLGLLLLYRRIKNKKE